MEKIPYVLWMLGWPLVSSLSDYLSHLQGRRFSYSTIGFATILSLVIWIYVGSLLY